MLTKLRAFASIYQELGPRWTLFRLVYAFRLRTGLIRLQMLMGEWSDYKNLISNKPAGRVGAAFFRSVSRPSELPENIPWDKRKAVEEADRILNRKTASPLAVAIAGIVASAPERKQALFGAVFGAYAGLGAQGSKFTRGIQGAVAGAVALATNDFIARQHVEMSHFLEAK